MERAWGEVVLLKRRRVVWREEAEAEKEAEKGGWVRVRAIFKRGEEPIKKTRAFIARA